MTYLPSYDVFNGVSKLGDNLLIDELEENIKAYLDWGFLNIGGYINVMCLLVDYMVVLSMS